MRIFVGDEEFDIIKHDGNIKAIVRRLKYCNSISLDAVSLNYFFDIEIDKGYLEEQIKIDFSFLIEEFYDNLELYKMALKKYRRLIVLE